MFAVFFHQGMNPFYQNIGSFPTVFFTFFLGLACLFWLVAVLGLIDIDILDVEPESDTNHSSPDALAALLLKFGLQGVPVTVVISLIALFGWLISYYLVHFISPLLPGTLIKFIASLAILLGALWGAIFITALAIKPIRPFFKQAGQSTEKRTLGQVAVVRSSVVDEHSGEAVLDDGGAGLILQVRPYHDTSFTRGERVVLLQYVQKSNIYKVISEQEFLN